MGLGREDQTQMGPTPDAGAVSRLTENRLSWVIKHQCCRQNHILALEVKKSRTQESALRPGQGRAAGSGASDLLIVRNASHFAVCKTRATKGLGDETTCPANSVGYMPIHLPYEPKSPKPCGALQALR
ncbi:hypothetical protein LA080_008850 [Diaporthe eres]|nr:hypothetical protein LA080_008850 [Diaporthe eres]